MAEPFRLPDGGRIERSRPLDFRFNGKRLTGYAGDTVASALLANGIHLVGRSFKYHRPRGIVTAGPEEPSALVQVGEGKARTEPNIRATVAELHQGMWTSSVNAWPSVEFDIGAVNSLFSKFFPAGFYYKTFMWPRSWWEPVYESFIRKAAGLGHAPEEPDPDRYDQTNAHCDVLVVGAGPAGLAAALAAARSGARVILADEQPEAGGSLTALPEETIDGKPAMDWVAEAVAELGQNDDVTLLPRSTVYGYFDHNFLGVLERVTDHLPIDERPAHLPRHRLWKVRAKQVVLATGAIERSLVFADNDRPGIMLAGAARSYVNRYAAKPGHKAVVMTNNDSGYAAALDLKNAGVEIAAVVDLRHAVDGPMSDRAEHEGLNILAGHGIIATEGAKRVSRVRVAPFAEDGSRSYGGGESLDCDVIAMSGGWSPAVHLFSQSKGTLVYDAEHGTFIPGEAAQATRCAGAANGAFGLDGCLEQGYAAGEQAAADAGVKSRGGRKNRPTGGSDHDFLPAEFPPLVAGEKPLGHKAKHFVDFQNDVTAADLKLALREGYSSIEHVKRYTTTGMGTDQGKLGNINALNIVAHTLGRDLPEVGVTTFRPPYTPVTFGAFAGRNVDDLLDPRRTTPMHSWHKRAGAVFEPVGQWLRAWYYPRKGEDMHAAVQRECKAVRDSLGILDATTLGKIDIQGPDSAEFLNRVYTNAWSKLEVGKCRYGLMLGEDGMVMDDGVTSRLEENRYLMTTTTGNAAQVLAHLERYLQTQWPELKVYLTSVTEQFATASIAGPNARKLLAELCDDI
ncbi:MAG: sarcosine oxidase subunit alpha family protein, partial [Rhodovibrionaceae bacterium]|nr:sarcosine oxidase subunit alpha family protein [Rhodovibrionaceae bacterium]